MAGLYWSLGPGTQNRNTGISKPKVLVKNVFGVTHASQEAGWLTEEAADVREKQCFVCAERRRSTGIFSGLSWEAASFEHIEPSGPLLGWYSRQEHIHASWRSWWRWHRRGCPLWSMHRTCRGVSSRCCCRIGLKARESNAQYVLKMLMWLDFVCSWCYGGTGVQFESRLGVSGCAPELPSWADRIRAAGGHLRAHAPPTQQQVARYLFVSGIPCFGAAEVSVGSWGPLHKDQYCKFSDRGGSRT